MLFHNGLVTLIGNNYNLYYDKTSLGEEAIRQRRRDQPRYRAEQAQRDLLISRPQRHRPLRANRADQRAPRDQQNTQSRPSHGREDRVQPDRDQLRLQHAHNHVHQAGGVGRVSQVPRGDHRGAHGKPRHRVFRGHQRRGRESRPGQDQALSHPWLCRHYD